MCDFERFVLQVLWILRQGIVTVLCMSHWFRVPVFDSPVTGLIDA